MTQLLLETYSGTDGQSLTEYNAAWTAVPGQQGGVIISGSRARHNTTSFASVFYRSDVAPPSADYSVSADLYFSAVSGSPSIGPCLRMSATAITMYQVRYVGGTGITLGRFLNGTASTLSTVAFTPTAGQTAKLTLKAEGTSLSVYLDDVLIIGPVTDANITAAGYVGHRMLSSASLVMIDNLSADDGAATGANGVATPSGVGCSAQVSSAAASGGARVIPNGVFASASVGTVSASAGVSASASPIGVAASSQVGTATARGSASVSPAGVGGSAQVGTATAFGGSSASAAPAGVSAAASVGSPVASGSAIARPAGVSAAASTGSAAASADARCTPAGVTAFASVGAVIAAGNIGIPENVFIDATKVPASRSVSFDGCIRKVVFTGGIRTVVFAGGTRTVRF